MNLLEQFDPGMTVILGGMTAAAIVAIVVLAAALFNLALRRSGPRVRHSIWLAALVLCALSPALIALVDLAGLVILPLHQPEATPAVLHPRPMPEASESITVPHPVVAPQDERVTKAPEQASVSLIAAAPAPVVLARPITWSHVRAVVFLIWLAGALFLFFRLIHGLFSLFLLKRSVQPLEPTLIDPLSTSIQQALGTKRALPRIATSTLPMEIPIAAGIFRPIVILPPRMVDTLSHDQLRDVLVHECAHAMRHDGLIGLLQRLTTLIFWPHPLIHWLNGRLVIAREEICDDYVLNHGDPARYAEGLLNLALTLGNTRLHTSAPGMLDSPSHLERRITRILEPGRTPSMRPNRWLTVASSLVLLTLAILVAGIRPVARAEPQEKQAVKPAPVADPKRPGTTASGIVVDETGKPVAGAKVEGIVGTGLISVESRSDSEGRFKLESGSDIAPITWVRASHAERKLGGAKSNLWLADDSFAPVPPLVVKMGPTRPLRVRVIDGKGEPVPEAKVQVEYLPAQLGQRRFYTTPAEKTAADGVVNINVPAHLTTARVLAYKPNVGFDYAEMYDEAPATKYRPLPAELILTLDSPRTVRFRAVDSKNQPIAGVHFIVTSIRKPGRLGWSHGSFRFDDGVTGADGIQALTFFPANGFVSVWGISPSPDLGSESIDIDRNTNLDETQTVRIFRRFERISGRVTHADGTPASGVRVRAQGHSAIQTGPPRRADGITDENGRYLLYVPPDASYILAAGTDKLVSPPVGALIVREGQEVRDINLQLGTGTRVHGQFVLDSKGQYDGIGLDNLAVSIQMLGGVLPEKYRRPIPTGQPQREWLILRVRSDKEGRYEFTLPAGDYELTPLGETTHQAQKVHVDGTGELVHNFDRQPEYVPPATREVTGTVVDATPGAAEKPLTGLTISSYILRPRGDGTPGSFQDTSVVSADGGRFSLTLLSYPVVLGAQTADGKLAGSVALPLGTKNVTLRLSPAAVVTGRVLDGNGRSMSNAAIVLIPVRDDADLRTRVRGPHAELQGDGRFRCTGVITGMKYEFRLAMRIRQPGAGPIILKTVTIDHPGVLDIGDFTVPDLSKPKP